MCHSNITNFFAGICGHEYSPSIHKVCLHNCRVFYRINISLLVVVPDMAAELTDEADLHLLIDGQRVNGLARPDGVHEFRLPQPPTDARIVSRACVPQAIGMTHDPRQLGVALRRIIVWRGRRLRLWEADNPALTDGFHAVESANGFRWTNGDAALPSSLFEGFAGTCTIELTIGCTARYPLAPSAERRRTARSERQRAA